MTTTDAPANECRALVPAPVEAELAPADLAVRRPPALVLAEAREAARAVADVIAAYPH